MRVAADLLAVTHMPKLSHGTNQLFTKHLKCPVFDYPLFTAIFLAQFLRRSPCNGRMGCSSTEPELSATCCGTKNPLGNCDNWTCVSSSNSLLEPLGDTQFACAHHLQELRGFYSWIMLLGEKRSCWLLSSFTYHQTLSRYFSFHYMT